MNKVNAGARAESFDSFKPKELPGTILAPRLYALSFIMKNKIKGGEYETIEMLPQ